MRSVAERLLGVSLTRAPLRIRPRRRAEAGETPYRPSRPSRLAAALDFLSDWGIIAFAAWTLLAYVGMATDARVSLLFPLWLATVPPLGAILVILSRRSNGPSAPEEVVPPRRARFAPLQRRYLLTASLLGALASAILAGAAPRVPWPPAWAAAFVAVVLALAGGRLRSGAPAVPGRVLAWPAHAFVVLVGLGFTTMSLFINRPNGDDTFYVNRATGVAQLNRIPVRDIIFTDERVAAVSGTGLPVDTFSALQGAFARFIGVHGASVAYYLTPPLMTFFATWALWRLLRAWAPRNVLLCFALGCVYWLFSAQSALTPGSLFLNRMWQGKVIFVAWLVLTAYVFLTRWLGRRDALTAVLLLAAGVGSIGMTASAAFVTPLLFGSAAVALLARRDWRGLPVIIAAAVFPLLAGLVATRAYPLVEAYQLVNKVPVSRGPFPYLGTSWYLKEVLGVGVLAAVGLTGLWAAPWLTRSGPAARLATGIAVVSVLLLAPAVLPAVNSLTDLTTVLRRTLWFMPLPALVGLLGAVPAGHLLRRGTGVLVVPRRLAVGAPALLVAGLLIVFGHPLWTSWRKDVPLWEPRPTWKVNQQSLASARTILRHYRGSAPILADEQLMHVIALITVSPKTVNPRSFYARLTPEAPRVTRDRLALTRFVMGEEPQPSRGEVRRALVDLRVGLVCVDESRALVIREVETIGTYREAFRARGRVCLQRALS